MPRPQFTLRALLVAMLVVATFFGGMRFERERQRREDEEAKKPWTVARYLAQPRPDSDMPRPQFTLKTMLWLTAVVGAFCAGATWQRKRTDHEMEMKDLIIEQHMGTIRILTGAEIPPPPHFP